MGTGPLAYEEQAASSGRDLRNRLRIPFDISGRNCQKASRDGAVWLQKDRQSFRCRR